MGGPSWLNRALPVVFLVISAIFAWSISGFLGAFLVFLGYCAGIWSGLAEARTTRRIGAGPVREAPRDLIAQLSSQQLDQIRGLMMSNRKIQAIKELRAATGAGLKEAKDAVEALKIVAEGEAARHGDGSRR